jgi:type IV secretory pathway TrbF-like protein
MIDSPFLTGKAYREDELGEAAVRRANWRYMAFAAMGLSGLLILLVFVLIILLRQVPVRVITVTDASGDVRLAQDDWRQYVPPSTAYVAQLRDDIITLRTITIDKEDMRRHHVRTRWRMTDEAKTLYNEYERTRKPFEQKEPVQVEILSVLHDGGLTWDVRWRETTYSDKITIEQWRGKFTLIKAKPQREEERQATPLGIFLNTWSWGKE